MITIVPGKWPKRGSKYKNQETVVNNIKFDSKREAARYRILRLLEIAEKILDLRTQQRFEIKVNNQLIGHYVADFTYWEDGSLVVEDAKGVRTDMYRWKKKLMKAVHGIEIKET